MRRLPSDPPPGHVFDFQIRQYNVPHVVVDPVMVSTSGHQLADGRVAAAMAEHLLPLATLVTPNTEEAAVLLGGPGLTPGFRAPQRGRD